VALTNGGIPKKGHSARAKTFCTYEVEAKFIVFSALHKNGWTTKEDWFKRIP
jgi:hypothetical protein